MEQKAHDKNYFNKKFVLGVKFRGKSFWLGYMTTEKGDETSRSHTNENLPQPWVINLKVTYQNIKFI